MKTRNNHIKIQQVQLQTKQQTKASIPYSMIECKLSIFNRNTWYHITVCKQIIVIIIDKKCASKKIIRFEHRKYQ